MKHTQGPLTVAPHSSPTIGTDWRTILAVGVGEYEPIYVGEALEADAVLFAAAPELLAALEVCRDAIQRLAKESSDGVPMWASEAHDAARAAIAKATNN